MPNRLADATSPYLLQHKDNPVDWREWGPEPFDEARKRDVPVLLSVGYAACHWCHVMAHESFEDPETADMMNRLFVNVKVDREERPDVDAIYMDAVQAMSGRGGWPMTVWLDPDGRPFYAGTYYPREPIHGMPSFRQVLDAISGAWQTRRDEVSEQAERLSHAIGRAIPVTEAPDESVLETAFGRIAADFDPTWGGFGGAPKFPQQPVLEFLLRAREKPWGGQADRIIHKTLDEMARGGIHDQIGGGFARYSVDQRWLVPHFEKMLYDNAQLARLYLWAGVELENDYFVEVARSTLDYMLRDLAHPEGGLYSSEDADSEGVEGKFYVWTPDEIRSVLGPSAEEIMTYYGVTDAGNFEGGNILHIVGDQAPAGIHTARDALFQARASRVRPGLDDKIVASWNGLAIRALAEAGAALGERRYLEAAEAAARFAASDLIVEGRLMRSWREGRTSVPGFADDHAALALGLYALYAATARLEWFRLAEQMVTELDRFDRPDGGFYTTASDGEQLITRPTDLTDNPVPSGNALAAEALLVSSLLSGDGDRRARSESALGAIGAIAERYPTMAGHHLSVALSMGETRELAIVGPGWEELARVHWARFRPATVLAASPVPVNDIPLLRGRDGANGTLAYVCEGFVCDLPTADPGRLGELLD